MDFAQFVGQGFSNEWRGILFRREYKEFDDLVEKSRKWYPRIFPGAKFIANKGDYKWIFPNGEKLFFRIGKNIQDYDSYHGHGYPWIGWEELTSWPNDELYITMMSICRSSHPGMPRHYRATCNPYGVGHNWVKARFIDPMPRGTVITDEQGRERVAIHGEIWENIHLLENDPGYLKSLQAQSGVKRKAWLEGDWDIVAGGMFDDVWDSSVHIVEPFEIPATWKIDRSFDRGSSKPYSVGFWAESDGCDVKLNDGSLRATQRGDLFRIAEIYGWTGKPNEGTREIPTEIARKIREYEKALGRTVHPGPADSEIFTIENGNCIASDMERMGIRWTRANKSSGSRINGWEILRERLKNSISREGPGIYTFDTCRQFIRTFPVLPRDKRQADDVDCLVAGTMVDTIKGSRPIENICVGDIVKTPIGWRPVTHSYVSGLSETTKIILENGIELEGTPRHKVYVEGIGLIPLSLLKKGLTLTRMISNLWVCQKQLYTKESATQDQGIASIILRAAGLLRKGLRAFIAKFGLIITVLYQKVFTSTISTTIPTIMELRIWNSWIHHNMPSNITSSEWQVVNSVENWINGDAVRRGNASFEIMLKRCLIDLPSENLRALIVKNLLRQNTRVKNTAPKNVLPLDFMKKILVFVKSVANHFLGKKLPIDPHGLVVINVVGSCEKKPVYNITVAQAHLFYANGILVTNTDAEDHCADEVRYRCLTKTYSISVRQAS